MYLHAKYERDLLRNCNKRVTEKSIISLSDLDPSNFKPNQKVEVHARYIRAKYEGDRLVIEGAMTNCKKSETLESIISLSDIDPIDLKPHHKVEVHARYLHAK